MDPSSECVCCRITEGPDTLRGVKCGDVLITYKMIWWDVRTSIDWLHVHVSYNRPVVIVYNSIM